MEEKRQEIICSKAKKCGACQLSNMNYAEQLEYKEKKVRILLDKYCRVNKIIGMHFPYHYRCKVQALYRYDFRQKKVVSGVFQSATNSLVPLDYCLNDDKTADKIIVAIRKMLSSFKLLPYNERTGRGFLRFVLVRKGFKSGQVMVVLATASSAFPSKNNFIRVLVAEHPEITTVVQNISDGDMNLVLGKYEHVLYGKGYIEDELCGLKFRISPKSFYQINPAQTEILYKKAIAAAELTPDDTVIDAYCGTGTIGLIASKSVKKVIGVESSKDAVRDAILNAKLNSVTNTEFVCADAGDFLSEAAENGLCADAVIMDPPRSGSSEMFLRSLLEMLPKKIVYISCNPETQARDIQLLANAYKIKMIQPVDMFPHTNHVETVVLLSKLHAKQHIDIELKTDELDLTASESKATYDEIKAYVKEHSGLSVSSLYIAQVKQKCGIIERENYNKAKSDDAKQPKCPKDKEMAIMDALKYFKMI